MAFWTQIAKSSRSLVVNPLVFSSVFKLFIGDRTPFFLAEPVLNPFSSPYTLQLCLNTSFLLSLTSILGFSSALPSKFPKFRPYKSGTGALEG